MFRKNRRLLPFAAIYILWLLVLIVWPPLGAQLIIGSLAVYLLISLFLPKNYALIFELLVVFILAVSMFIHSETIFNDQPIAVLLHIIILILITTFLTIKDSRKTSIPPTFSGVGAGERQKLVALINSMADGVVATDQNKLVTVYNGAALDVLNVNVSLEGQQLTSLMSLTDSKGKPVDIFKLASESRTSYVTRDLILHYSDGEKINLYLSIAPVTVGYGQRSTLGYIILIRDITKEKSLEEERDEFISVVSHELRTPITVAEGSISNAQFMAKKSEADEGVLASLDDAHKTTVFLADMINDLSMLSRAERGVLQVDPESIDIQEMLKTLQKEYEVQAKQKGLEILIEETESIKPVTSAQLYVKEILQNFITNSIKYTEKGSITLSAESTKTGVDVKVKDTGIGISVSDQKKLFEKFFRSEDFRTRQSSGTGLGLYVTMKLAHLIGAKINVESKVDHGSEFTISIPNLKAHLKAKD